MIQQEKCQNTIILIRPTQFSHML